MWANKIEMETFLSNCNVSILYFHFFSRLFAAFVAIACSGLDDVKL